MKVGFVGLGNMGQSMAANFLKADVDLTVFDTREEPVKELVAKGAKGARSLAELTERSDVLFLSLPGPKQIEKVIFGENGVADNLPSGTVVFDLSTNSLSLVKRSHLALKEKGAFLLDAPVSGGVGGASSGKLGIWVGGDKAIFKKHLHHLKMIGDAPRYVGPVGSGTVVKLTHNMAAQMILLSLSEVFSVGVKAGVDPLDLWEALKDGSIGRNSCLDLLVPQFLPATYEPAAFALNLAHKDITLATSLSRELNVPTRIASLTMEEMSEAVQQGMGDLDFRAFLGLQLKRSDVHIEIEPASLQEAVARARKA